MARGNRRSAMQSKPDSYFAGLPMDAEVFNLSIRKFLKMVGVKSQIEIERAVAAGLDGQAITGDAALPVTMTLKIPALGVDVEFQGTIELDRAS